MIIIDPMWEVVHVVGVPGRRCSEDDCYDETMIAYILSEYEAEDLAEMLADRQLTINEEVGTVEKEVVGEEARFTPGNVEDGERYEYDECFIARPAVLKVHTTAAEYLAGKES